MQFYIIDEDPEINAKELPDYCLLKVNIREGWQILSDIGHALGVAWEGQNKEYNRYHAETRQYWKSLKNFINFNNHYMACLNEYFYRFSKYTVWHERYLNSFKVATYKDLMDKLDGFNKYRQIIEYLATRKAKHLTNEEIEKLRGKL